MVIFPGGETTIALDDDEDDYVRPLDSLARITRIHNVKESLKSAMGGSLTDGRE